MTCCQIKHMHTNESVCRVAQVARWSATSEAFATRQSHRKQNIYTFTFTKHLHTSHGWRCHRRQDKQCCSTRSSVSCLWICHKHIHTGRGLLWPFTDFSWKCGNPVRKLELNKQSRQQKVATHFLLSFPDCRSHMFPVICRSCRWYNGICWACDQSENTNTGAWSVRAKCLCLQSCQGLDIITTAGWICVYVCVSAQVA